MWGIYLVLKKHRMVIKTGMCEYTEYKVYPGRGQRFVSKDGKIHLFISKKSKNLFLRKTKPVKLTWTQAWRRFNQKGKIEHGARRRQRRKVKIQKAIVGMSLDVINRKKQADEKSKVRVEAQREIKERQSKKKEVKRSEKQKRQLVSKKQVPKNQPGAGKGKGKGRRA